jgi:hypothetical protein
VPFDGSVTLSAKLIVTDLAEYERMGGNAVSGRVVTIQRRVPGGTWASLASMTAGAGGTYRYVASSLRATYEWRAVFSKPSTEGLRGDTSNGITVSVTGGCSSPPCPLSEAS